MESCWIKTDETLRETVRHGSDRYPFQFYLEDVWAFDFHCVDWHWHPELELVYVRSGTVEACVGVSRITLPAGSGMLVNSGVLHRFESQASTSVPNIVFSPALLAPENSLLYEKYVRPVLDTAAPFQVFRPGEAWQDDLLDRLRELLKMQEAPDVSELATVSRLLALWQVLFAHTAFLADPRTLSGPDLRQARLRLMMQFIQDNYAKDLSLEEIAASAAISGSSALHIFRSAIHLSPVAYLIQYRLSQAARRLCSTQEPVASIAEEAGFSSAGYFCRRFRESYHMTPGEYRRRSRNG